MFTREHKNKLWSAAIALLFSLVLFFNANGTTFKTSLISPTASEVTLEDIAIQPVYNTNEFFIHGFDPTVRVKLSSVNRVLLDTESNEQTRNFKIVADLTNLGVGTHNVALKVQNLNNNVTATVEPSSIPVTIEKRVTKKFKIEIPISEENLAEGYQLGEVITNQTEAEVITGEDTLKEISKVMASVDDLQNLSEDTEKEATIYAVNYQGERLPAILQPDKVKIQIKLVAPEKEVDLVVKQTGKMGDGISHFEYELSPKKVFVTGPLQKISNLREIEIPIDVTGISENVKRTIDLPISQDIHAIINQIVVDIKPVYFETETSKTETTTTDSTTETTKKSETTKTSTESTIDE